MDRLIKDTLFAGRYLLVRQVGVGGFSEVWQAADQEADGVTVALKVYAPGKGLDDDGINLFRKEYAITIPINHPNLLKIQYFGVSDGCPYLIMPYCANGSVGSRLHAGKIYTEDEIAILLRQIAGSLAYLHSRNPPILHQDIKPDNVLIDEDGNYMLTDFGISSRMRHTMAKSTGKTSTSLSIAYAPPERFSGTPRSLEVSDVFSLGVMLYELCTGDVPWMGNGGAALLRGAEVPNLPPPYSKRLNDIIKSCLDIEPEKRPSSKRLADLTVLYEKEGYWEDVKAKTTVVAKPRTIRLKWVAAGAAALLGVVAGVWAFRTFAGGERVRPAGDRKDFYVYFDQGDSLYGLKQYDKALMQYYIARAFDSLKQSVTLDARIAECESLLAEVGFTPEKIETIEGAALGEVSRISGHTPPSVRTRLAATRPDTAGTAAPAAAPAPAASVPEPAGDRFLGVLQKGRVFLLQNDFANALPNIRKASEAGLAEAQFLLGICYANGSGVPQDAVKARVWFEKSFGQGYKFAAYPLGVLYREGKTVKSNPAQARNYFDQSLREMTSLANQGDPIAQAYLADFYENGFRTGGKDEKSALAWYDKAARQGYVPAQTALGRMYNEGRGTEKDHVTANEWLAKAAAQQHPEAQYLLGANLIFNKGRKSLPEGAALLRKAATQGHPEAQYYAGVLSAFGQGTAPSRDAAQQLLRQAQANGVDKAKGVLDFLDGKLNRTFAFENKEAGAKMKITVDYGPASGSLGLFADKNQAAGKLNFTIEYEYQSLDSYCHIETQDGDGFQLKTGAPPLHNKSGLFKPYIARKQEGIMNGPVTFVMYFEKNNEKIDAQTNQKTKQRQRRKLIEAEVPVVAVWL